MQTKFLPNLLLSGLTVLGLVKIGLYSSNKDMNIYYKELFDKYKDEVTNPKYRGLKLFKNKKVYQVD